MQKLLVGLVLAAACGALPARAAEGDPENATEAPPASAEGELLAFPAEEGEGEGQTTPSSTEPEVAPEGSGNVDRQSASAPGKAPDAGTSTLTQNVLLFNQQATQSKKFGLIATLSTFAGSGTFLANDPLRRQSDYVAQILDLRPTFGFNLGRHRLRLQGRVAFEAEYTQPNTNPSRRFKPFDTSITFADDTLWEFREILFNAAFRLALPTSYESISIRQQWLAATLSGGARRLVGPVQLGLFAGVTKYVNGAKTAQRRLDNPRGDDTETNDTSRPSVSDPVDINAGYANNNWLFSTSASVTYLASDYLALSYSVGLLNFIRYTIADDRDGFTSPFGDSGAGTAQLFQSGLNVSYDVGHFVQDLPFRLTASVGASSLHPVQQPDNTGWIAPIVFNTFFDRAANNYGTIYFDLTGIY